jgi:VWFA-related protein
MKAANSMKTGWVRVVVAMSIAGSLGLQPLAQQDPIPTPGVIRINVNLVQVDAVVTDSKGKPVTNLKAEDFEVLQDGKVQKIRNFEFIPLKERLASLAVSSGVTPPRSGPAAPPPSRTLRPDQVRRTIALVVDDIALSFDGTVGVRDALRKWVDTEMQPGDLVSVVRTNASIGALQQFTNDKRMLHAAIDQLKFQPGRIGVQSFAPTAAAGPDTLSAPDTANFEMELRSAYLVGSLNAIRYVMQGLRDIPGRKSLILFSEDLGLPSVDSSANMRQSTEDRLRKLADEANRASVVFYAIDPRGSIYTGPTASDATVDSSLIGARSLQLITSQDGMVLLAQKTGGLFYAGSNDLNAPLRQAIDDGDGYYLMGYQPEEKTFNADMDMPKYHSITVRVKRPGLRVRSRSGFFGMSDARPVPSGPETPQSQIAKALVSPFAAADLKVRLTTMFTHSGKGGSHLQTLLYFDTHDLTFKEEADGARSAVVDIALVTFNENGDPAETVHKTWNLRVPKERYDDLLKKGMVYSALVPVKKAGPYQLRAAVRDAGNGKVGSAMQFVDVPNVDGGRLALSGIAMAVDPAVADNTDGMPAVRVFKSGEAITYAYEILNAETSGNRKPQLETQVRLYRNGEIVYDAPPSALNPGTDGSSDRLIVRGRMRLTKIPAGDYVLQVVVLDNLRKDKNKLAAQAIDFEVR